ncbi:MAG: glucosyltransferase domain-containing protein [Clostridia bacterium]|nr:glucosyltransferase domain-containing protein [Clostridia bacterium]
MLDKKNNSNLLSAITAYFKNVPYTIVVLITTISSYLFFVTHFSVSNDDLSRERYIFDGYIAAQGRFSGSVVARVFDLFGVDTGLMEILGVFFLMISAVVFCVCFDRLYKTANKIPQLLFSCFLITYPLHAEIFVYTGCTLSVGLGFFLVSISIWIIENSLEIAGNENFCFESLKISLLPTIFLMIVTSWYESVLCVYFGAVFALIGLKMFSYNDKEKFTFRRFVSYGIHFAIPLCVAVILEFIIQKIIIGIMDLDIYNFAANKATLLVDFSWSNIVLMIRSIASYWVLPIFYYLPITVFAISVIVGLICFLAISVWNKDFKYILVFAGLILSTAILTVLRLGAADYRISQPVAFFVAFMVFMVLILLYENKKRLFIVLRKIVVAVLIIVCINQITELNYWFNLEDIKYQNEKATVQQIANKLDTEYDTEKPVVFVGKYYVGDYVEEKVVIQEGTFAYKLWKLFFDGNGEKMYRRIPQTICLPYITWAVDAFGEVNTELLKFFSYLGYDYIQGTKEMYKDALIKAENKPAWPQNGSISDEGEYILINFGVEPAKAE